ncbi:uncharacterized protein [Henckelia pumila]|uniref:uncharacterized protein n=1 Tax=Henckelia pumila TaxID=405737 RepID=UPI003C6E720C
MWRNWPHEEGLPTGYRRISVWIWFSSFRSTKVAGTVYWEHQPETACTRTGVCAESGSDSAGDEDVIAGKFLLCSIPAFVLIDISASHSFISTRFVKRYRLPYMPLDVVLSVSTPTGHSALAKHLVIGCTLEFEGSELLANLMVLAMEDFDFILGIDILTYYRATLDFYQKIFQFRLVEGNSWFFYGEGERTLMPLVSSLRTTQALEAGGKVYLIHVIDTSVGRRPIEKLLIVCEYPDVFPDDIPGFPPIQEVEFGIELVSGTAPISRAPYRLALAEMR